MKCRNCGGKKRPIIKDNLCDLCICPVCDEEQDDYILDYIIEDEEDPQPLPCYECALEGYFAAMQK